MNMLFNLASSVMNFLGSPAGLIAANAWEDYKGDPKYGWVYSLCEALNNLLTPVLILVGTAGLIYAVVLGVNLARADSADKQQEAKKRLIYAIVGLAVIVLLIILMRLFMANIDSFVKIDISETTT
ncbi:MAG: hypothetical protein IJU58_01075 [Clostridia bacterium]|nr:hypothetical protein [Clostridia bacterium]